MTGSKLFISPHLDDVALSCAAQLIDSCAGDEAVVVATVFTGATGKARPRYRARRREDRAALTSIGAEVRHLGLNDAPFRLGCGWRSQRLTGDPSDPHVNEARGAIVALLAEVQPDEVWFPLGVGRHVDHLAVFAAHNVVSTPRFYVERPYSFDEAALRHRLREVPMAVSSLHWPRARLEAVVALVDGYRTQVAHLFGATSCRAAYEQHAVQGEHIIELVAATPIDAD